MATEEWFEVSGWFNDVKGLIPRTAVESLGIDCSPADRTPRGTIWVTAEQSKAIHKHPRWEQVVTP